MRWMIALMSCIAMLGTALALWAVPAAASLGAEVAGRLSIQLTDADAASRRDGVVRLSAAFGGAPFVRRVTVVPDGELRAMAENWLGEGVGAADLPIPALIDVDLVSAADPAMIARASQLAHSVAPGARIIPHGDWLGPVARLMASVGWIASLLALALLLGAATIAAMAARAALAAQQSTIEIFHLVGATDQQIMRLFQKLIVRQTMVGAAIGAGIALLVATWLMFTGSALTQGLSDRGMPATVVLALLVPVLVVLVAMLSARMALAQALRDAP